MLRFLYTSAVHTGLLANNYSFEWDKKPVSAKNYEGFLLVTLHILKTNLITPFAPSPVKNALNHYDNLPADLKSPSLLSTLQCLGELWNNKKK